MTSTSNLFYQNFLSLIAQSTKLPNIYHSDSTKNDINVVSVLETNECLVDDFYHMIYFTDNILTTSFYFTEALGFQEIYYSSLDSNNKFFCSKVLKNGNIIIEVLSPLSYQILDTENINFASIKYEQIITVLAKDFITKHGNGIGLISFESDWKKSRQILNKLKVNKYLKSNLDVYNFQEKEPWSSFIVKIDKSDMSQMILSNVDTHFSSKSIYKKVETIKEIEPQLTFERVDHTVLNVLEGNLNEVSAVMKELYQLVDFWKPKSLIKTSKTGLNTKVVASKRMDSFEKDSNLNKCVKFPINEPLIVDKSHLGQIEEFLLIYNGPGIQHIAISCKNIIDTIEFIASKGHVNFLKISPSEFDNYYNRVYELLLKSREKYEDINLQKFVTYLLNNIDRIKSLNILVDINVENEILLQIFTKSLSGRPCLFFEFIQRFRNEGFGEGNFNSLFKSLEEEQKSRNTL